MTSIPSLARQHAQEFKILEYLKWDGKRDVLTSEGFRRLLKEKMVKAAENRAGGQSEDQKQADGNNSGEELGKKTVAGRAEVVSESGTRMVEGEFAAAASHTTHKSFFSAGPYKQSYTSPACETLNNSSSNEAGTVTPEPSTILFIPRTNPHSSKSYSNSSTITTLSNPAAESMRSAVAVVEIPESRVEWAKRMRRYQMEEVQHLGLDLISSDPNVLNRTPAPFDRTCYLEKADIIPRVEPRRPLQQLANTIGQPHPNQFLSTAAESPDAKEAKGSEGQRPRRHIKPRRPNKSAKLSKERFEKWLDSLTPGSPIIGTSRPSTSVANSEIDPPGLPDKDENVFALESISQGDVPVLEEGIEGPCRECGKVKRDGSVFDRVDQGRVERGKAIRDWGVQTDISGCLIVF